MQAQRGAVLIEQVVAIALLAIVVVGVYSLLSVGYLASAMAQDLGVATNLAQRKLEEIKAAGCQGAVSLPRQPVDASAHPGYEWEVETVAVAPQLKEVRATVYWKARGRERSVSLVTVVRKP